MKKTDAQIFLAYIRSLLLETEKAKLDREELSPETSELADALEYLGECVREERLMLNALSQGDLDYDASQCRNYLAAPVKSIQSNLHHLAWVARRVTQGDYKQRVYMLGSFSDSFNEMIRQLGENHAEVEKIIHRDPLTGVGNRRFFNKTVEALLAEKKRFCIAYIDIDRLKTCNDTYGHEEGDRYIRSVCECLQSDSIGGESLFRIGGDEFVLISTETDARTLDARLQKALENYTEAQERIASYPCSFSFGCTDVKGDEDVNFSEVLSLADKLMYNAKLKSYIRRRHYPDYAKNPEEGPLDKTGLESRIFTALSNCSANHYTYLCNMKTNVSRWSLSAVFDFDLPSEYMLAADSIWEERIHPDDRAAYRMDLEAVFSGRKPFHNIEYRARFRDGSYVRCTCEGCILRGNGADEPDLFAGTLTNHGVIDSVDPVTNRGNVYAFLKLLLHKRLLHESAFIMILGLNQYVAINNTYGYKVGDQALKLFADRITGLLPASDCLYRLDGVKFAIVLPLEKQTEAAGLFDSLKAIAEKEIFVDQCHVPLSLSGASVAFDALTVNESTVLTELTQLLSEAKQTHASVLYEHAQTRAIQVQKHMLLMEAVTKSILYDCRGFFLVYQPQVDGNRRIIGAECLLRWRDETGGTVMPGSFIPWLEKGSYFYILGLWIIRTAVRETREFLKIDPNFSVSVNVSYRQLENQQFLSDLLQLLAKENFPKQNLLLELTEHCQTLNIDLLTRTIREFHRQGVRVSADDFGTGYSSFSLMKTIDFDMIKIDQSFIKNIRNQVEDQVMVESIIRCARTLHRSVCVEGVETQEIFDFIRRYHPDCYQGYLFSRPISHPQMVERLGQTL